MEVFSLIGQGTLFLYYGNVEARMTNKELYTLIHEYQQEGFEHIFSEDDLFAVALPDKTVAYVSIMEDALALYIGEYGLRGYLNLCYLDPDAPMREKVEVDADLECYILRLDRNKEHLDEEELRDIEESGVGFEQGHFPKVEIQRRYRLPWKLTESEKENFAVALQGILFAKDYVAQFGKTTRASSLTAWLESMALEDSENREYYPLLIPSEEKAGHFTVEARELSLNLLEEEFPQARLTNETKLTHYRRMKAKVGKVFYIATFVLEDPIEDPQGGAPIFPICYLLYDPQEREVLDFFLVIDYEAEHTKFAARLFDAFDEVGKPQAIHCFGKRTFPLFSYLGKQLSIMVTHGKKEAGFDAIIEEFLQEAQEEVEQQHVHGPECSHDHHA